MLTKDEFYEWEKASRDTIDVKRCYIDIAGDLVSGLLLSQVIYWFIPGEHGSKLRVEKEGKLWLAKGRADWWDECRISPKQFDRAAKILSVLGLVETRKFRFKGSPTIHIWLNLETLLEGVNSNLTKGQIANVPEEIITSPSVNIQSAQKVKTLTKTTPQNTTKNTAEISSSNSRPDYFKSYESEIGILTPMIAESMLSDLETYPEEWLIDAIKVASSANKRSYRYVQGILRKWADDGRDVKPEDLSLEETIRARQVSSVVGRMEDIGKHAEQVLEVVNRPEYSEEDINFLDSFILSNQSLYKIARCLRGETPASNGNLIIWRTSLLKLGIEVKVPEKQAPLIDVKTPS